MIFRKKKPRRLYIPAKSKWYTRPHTQKRKKFWVRGKKKAHFKRQFQLLKKQWFYWIAGILVVIAVFLALFFSTYFSIARIHVVRHDLHVDSAAIQEILKPYIGQNLLFFERRLASEKVKTNFVEYAKVQVKKTFPNTLKIELESHPLLFNIRSSYLLPRAEEDSDPLSNVSEEAAGLAENPSAPPMERTEQKGLLNTAGQVILNRDENLELSPLIIEGMTRPIEDREVILLPQRLDDLRAAIEKFENLFPQRVDRLHYFPEGREIHLKIESGLELWLTFEKDLVEQIEKLYSIYQPAALDQEDIAYIDLRVIEKVIYCPRGATCDRPR